MYSLYGISVLIYLLRLVKHGLYVCIGKDGNRVAHEVSVSFTVEVSEVSCFYSKLLHIPILK